MVVKQSNNNSRQDRLSAAEFSERRDPCQQGRVPPEAGLAGWKMRIGQDIGQGFPGKESSVKKGHEVRVHRGLGQQGGQSRKTEGVCTEKGGMASGIWRRRLQEL